LTVAVNVTSAYLECLFLVLAVDAVRNGRRIYIGAVIGLAVAILGRMSEGFSAPGAVGVMKVAGLLLAGLILAVDLFFEEPPADEDEPQRIRT
jgi:hypothetical protein